MKTALLIPTLDEIGGMKDIMPRIKREWCDEIIIVDGGSTDGTVEYARENGYRVISQKKKGLRCAYVEALDHIDSDVVITFSPDGNSIPELIPPLVDKMKEGHDMVVVSRYLDGAKSYDDDIITGFGNWMFTKIINILFRAKYTDTLVIFRAYKKDLFKTLELDRDCNYSFEEKLLRTKIGLEPLLSLRCAKRRLKVAEIPGDEPLRTKGSRKLRVFRYGAAHIIQILRELFYWR